MTQDDLDDRNLASNYNVISAEEEEVKFPKLDSMDTVTKLGKIPKGWRDWEKKNRVDFGCKLC